MLFLYAILLCSNSHAQDAAAFKKVEGLNSNVVYCVMQDSKGYIWVGTEAGASRYDGYGFKHFTKDDGISDNDIFQIKEDKKGRLWFLTYNGEPTVYDHGHILTPKNTPFLAAIKPGRMATGFVERGDTISYITQTKVYLLVRDSLVSVITANSIGIKNPYFFFQNETVWNGTTYYINPSGMHATDKEKTIYFHFNDIKFDAVATKVLVKNNKLWLRFTGGILAFDMVDKSMKKLLVPKPVHVINIVASQYDTMIQLLTDRGVYDINTNRFTITKNEQFAQVPISSLIRDREQNHWLGSHKEGLFLFTNTTVKQLKNAQNKVAAYSLTVFNHNVYAGFTNNKVEQVNGQKLLDKSFVHEPAPTKIYGFFPTSSHLLVAAGNLLKIIGRNGQMQVRLKSVAKAVAMDRDSNLYLGLSYNVAKISRGELHRIKASENIAPYAHYLFEERVNSILCTGMDSVWLGALSGIQLLVKDRLVTHFLPKAPVFQTSVSKVINTKYGIAFSTWGEGVVLMTKDSTYILDKAKGLVNNSCNSIYASNDTLWIATVSGLTRVTIQQQNRYLVFSYRQYTEAFGLVSNRINDVLVHNDTVWLATEKGVCYFSSKEKELAFAPPRMLIEQVLINGKATAFDQPLTLPYQQNNIQIRYLGISYYSKGNIAYRYKLQGAEDGWHETNLRQVEYPALTPGHYRFLIMAANADGVWNNAPEELSFDIIPPFWQTGWFQLLMVLVAALLLGVFMRYRLMQQQQRHVLANKALSLEKEKAEYEKQLLLLEQQALRLQMNPHFIFNALTAVQGLYAAGKTFEAKEYLQRFSRMLRNIFEVSAQPFIPLSKELELITDYIELTVSKLKYRIEYRIDCNIDKEKHAIPPLLLQPFVENALIHGLLPMKRNGNLLISIHQKDGYILFTIEDDGKGLDAAQLQQNGRPHGLAVTKQRIELLNNHTGPDVTMETLIGKDGSIAGTKITFTTIIIYTHD